MKAFCIGVTLSCPSDWTEQRCREYMERILTTPQEKASLVIHEVDLWRDGPTTPAPTEPKDGAR